MPRIDLWTTVVSGRACLAAIFLLGIVATTRAPRDRLTVQGRSEVSDPSMKTEASALATSPTTVTDSFPVSRNPFAPWTSADPGRFDPARFAAEQDTRAENPAADLRRGPTPPLVLQGLILGPNPRAILSGVPGARRAVVMEPGDESGGLTVISVDATGVRVRWADSTWVVARTEGAGG